MRCQDFLKRHRRKECQCVQSVRKYVIHSPRRQASLSNGMRKIITVGYLRQLSRKQVFMSDGKDWARKPSAAEQVSGTGYKHDVTALGPSSPSPQQLSAFSYLSTPAANLYPYICIATEYHPSFSDTYDSIAMLAQVSLPG